ncbi:hypothetical protein pb186bvf_011865 [Paramecium bursaria]
MKFYNILLNYFLIIACQQREKLNIVEELKPKLIKNNYIYNNSPQTNKLGFSFVINLFGFRKEKQREI